MANLRRYTNMKVIYAMYVLIEIMIYLQCWITRGIY